MKIRPVEADKLTDGRTDMANITVAFSNFANAPNKNWPMWLYTYGRGAGGDRFIQRNEAGSERTKLQCGA
jgi:hypothetical protein